MSIAWVRPSSSHSSLEPSSVPQIKLARRQLHNSTYDAWVANESGAPC